MIENLVTLLGRHVHMRGIDRALQVAYPCRFDSPRFVRGQRQRTDSLWMTLDTRTLIDWHLCFHGEWEPHLGELFLCLLEPGATAIDVGANVGAHTLTLARLVGATGRVMAFEPNPAVHAKLLENVQLNGLEQVTVYACALGADEARLELKVPAADSAEASNPGLASLVALDTPHDTVAVEVRPLDAVVANAKISRLDVVKIDVQGYEPHVFAGMQQTIAKFAPAVLFEYEDWAWRDAASSYADAAAWFERAGYALWRINGGRAARGGSHGVSLASVPASTVPGTHADLIALPKADHRLARLQRYIEVRHG